MRRILLVFALLSCCACAPQQKLDPQARIRQIRRADPSQYLRVQDMRDWRNPYITVFQNELELRAGNPRAAKKVRLADLRQALVDLPDSAWPYGRVVGLSETGLLGPEDNRDVIRANFEEVRQILRSMDIAENPVPSA